MSSHHFCHIQLLGRVRNLVSRCGACGYSSREQEKARPMEAFLLSWVEVWEMFQQKYNYRDVMLEMLRVLVTLTSSIVSSKYLFGSVSSKTRLIVLPRWLISLILKLLAVSRRLACWMTKRKNSRRLRDLEVLNRRREGFFNEFYWTVQDWLAQT